MGTSTRASLRSNNNMLIGAAVLLGVALRVREYVFNRSLWFDEAVVGNDILHTGFRGLVHPLAGQQAAPIGWLWLERASVHILGTSEASLRFWPFVSSLGLMVVTPVVARRLLSSRATAVATALVAVSPQLIYFAAEVKPYGSDGLAVLLVVLMLVTEALWDRMWTALLASVALSALCWCSFPAVFVVGAGLAVLFVLRLRGRQALAPVLVGGALASAAVLLDYLVSLRKLSENGFLHAYWQSKGGFPPARAGVTDLLAWMLRQPAHVLHYPGQLAFAPVALALTVIGAYAIGRNVPLRRPLLLLLSAPAAGIAVAALDRYPLAIRVALWMVPIALILLAGVLDLPEGALAAALFAVPLILVSASSMASGISAFASPLNNTDARGSYAFVARYRQPGDILLTEAWSDPTYSYYGPRYKLTRDADFTVSSEATCSPPAPLAGFAGHRVWIVFNHHGSNQPADRTDRYMSYFSQYGAILRSWHGYGDAAAYLVAFSRPGPESIHAPHWWVPDGCLTLY